MKCNYNKDEFCTNDQCPICGEKCPVPEVGLICQYEERDTVDCALTPMGCFDIALLANDIKLDNSTLDAVWKDFVELMTRMGYVQVNE